MSEGSDGPGTGEWKLSILQKELPEGELLQKGIPKRELRRVMLADGEKGIKAAN
jgi:hypothetical protein